MLYRDPAAAPDTRAADLLARMTRDEKIAQMHALWLILSPDGDHRMRSDSFTGTDASPRVADMLTHGLGQITRPLGTRAIDPRDGVRALNHLQRHMVHETRLGIPVLSHEECLSGLMCSGATLFPSANAYGATWNPDLIAQVGAAIGAECASVGARQGLAPVLDVARDARWGRTEECFAEDPYLTGLMAMAYVRGLQGPNRQVLATLKHFVGHSLSEGARNHAPVQLGWRRLCDDFMLPFEMAVKGANAGSIMPAYHDIDGEPVHASEHLMTRVLRDDWGFDGLLVADYIGVTLLHSHHGIATDLAEAGALSFTAGLDVELPGRDCAAHLDDALERGLISIDTVDQIVTRILTEKFRLRLFEQPFTDEDAIALRQPDTLDLAQEVATQAITILDNDGILPLSGTPHVAVIGPTADDPLAMLGDYSFPVHLIAQDQTADTDRIVTPLAGLIAALGSDHVTYAQGCAILDHRGAGAPVFPGDVPDHATVQLDSPVSTRRDLISDAVAAARAADVALVCVGDLSGIFQTGTVGEGSDAATLDLPGVQQDLLNAVLDTGTPTVVVLTSGRPYTLGGMEPRLAAQVMAWFPGERGGMALADVLTGRAEPSGRLPLSVPRDAGACPYFYNHAFKSAGTPVARHFGSDYPFGHGLSYTAFDILDVTLAADQIDVVTGELCLSFTVRNVGDRDGVAVPQLYVRDRLASVVRPVKELKCFGRITLAPGASQRLTMRVPTDMLNFTGMAGARIVEPGDFDLMLGWSSADIRWHGTVTLTGDTHTLPRDWRMTSDCTPAT